jgi:uracil-DNA glycosylase family 4
LFVDGSQDTKLFDAAKTAFVPTVACHVTNKSKALLVVGEAPGADEDRIGQPFLGKSGTILRRVYIKAMGLDKYADIYLTNAVRCRPPDNRTPRPGEIKKHWPYLEQDILALSKKYKEIIVLAAGATPAKGFGFNSLRAAYKSQGGIKKVGPVSVRFYCTNHPAALMYDESLKKAVKSHLSLLRRYLSGEKLATPRAKSATRAPSRFNGDAPHVVCLDIETYGCLRGYNQTQFHPVKSVRWDKVKRDKMLVSCALAWDGGTAFYNLTLAKHRIALCNVLRQLQKAGSTLLLQNATFDLTFLRHCIPALRSILTPPLKLADLLVSSYLVDEVRPEKSLKALSPLLLGAEGLYTDEQRSLNYPSADDPELMEYNIADVVRTLECHKLCERSYASHYGKTTAKGSAYSKNWFSNLLWLAVWMSESGVSIQEAGLRRLHRTLHKRKLKLEAAGDQLLGLVCAGKGSDKSRRSAVKDAMLCIADRKVTGRVVLTTTGKVPFDAETRNMLLPHVPKSERDIRRRLTVMGRHQDVSKLTSTYTGPMLFGRKKGKTVFNAPRIINGKVYPVWYPVPREFGASDATGGTRTGRFAAKDPSVPTFPPSVKALVKVDAWIDYSQIELRIAALLANDEVMMAEYAGDPDLHGRTAKLIFGDDIVNHPLYKLIHRQAGKSINFLMLYRGGADKFRETLLTKADIDYPIEKCRDAISRFWSEYSGLRKWQDGLIDFVCRHGYYELPMTGQSRSFDRRQLPVNEIVNFPVQGIASNVMQDAQFTLWNTARLRGIGLSAPLNVYDATGLVLTPLERKRYGTRRAETLIREVMGQPRYYLDLCAKLGRSLPLGYELKWVTK